MKLSKYICLIYILLVLLQTESLGLFQRKEYPFGFGAHWAPHEMSGIRAEEDELKDFLGSERLGAWLELKHSELLSVMYLLMFDWIPSSAGLKPTYYRP